MTELINLIINKPNWEKKILDPAIVAKWKEEISKQYSSKQSSTLVDLVIDLLKQYKKGEYNDDDVYKWVIELNLKAKDFAIADQCKCPCPVCTDEEYVLSSDYEDDKEEDEEDDEQRTIEIQVLRQLECQCLKQVIEIKKRNFLYTHTNTNDCLVPDQLKDKFKLEVNNFQKTILLDYHPGSHDQIVNLVHPSLYCYVKGVTQTKAVPMDPNVIFQWLPAEFKVSKEAVKIGSDINNLDRGKNPELYESIADIFKLFVPKFEYVLHKLAKEKRIKRYSPLDNCQVIVKLANAILTPDSPTSNEGSWHLEGLPHEKIIATGIYYYEMSNIQENYLNFRGTIPVSYDLNYPQNATKYVETHYDLHATDDDHEYSTIVDLGRVQTNEDMCLVFPNFLQHKVSDLSLIDPTKPGSRKILVFFLIDPSARILSTQDVAPQQSLMTLEDAKLYRELLMFQRKFEINEQNSFYKRGWSLCEH